VSGIPRSRPGDNPYGILGVPPGANMEEITRAYRRLLRQHHPDTAPGHTEADHHRLQQIMAAYQELRHAHRTATTHTGVPITVHHHGTPERRRNLDEAWPGNQNASGSGRRRIPIAHRGIDTTAAVTITHDQAHTGGIVTITTPDNPADGHRLRNIRIRIPAGTRDGQTLRIPGRGASGINGGAPGDLHLTVYHAGIPGAGNA
jgi:curved DNA-binding protein